MLYVFYGSDVVGVREKAHEFLSTYEEKGIKTVRISEENFEEGILENYAGAVSLFGGKQIVVIDTPSGNKEMQEIVMEKLDMLAESGNVFVLIEEVLLAPAKKKIGKYAEEVTEVTAGKIERFNVFAMADAILRRDKKSLWILLQEAKTHGLSEEEIIGTLWWQLKSLRLASLTTSADESGLKPFVYSKAKKALSKFKEGELEKISENLLSVYHDGHLGKRDIDFALEKWTLTL